MKRIRLFPPPPLFLSFISFRTSVYVCAYLYIVGEGSRFERNQSSRNPVMRIRPDFIVAQCNETSREDQLSLLNSISFPRRLIGRPSTILYHLSSSLVFGSRPVPRSLSVFPIPAAVPRAPVPAGRWLVRIYPSILIPDHHLFPSSFPPYPPDSFNRAAFVERSFFFSRHVAFCCRRAVVDKSFPSNLTYGFLPRSRK